MKILTRYGLTYGLLMLVWLGVSFMLNSSPRMRHEHFFPYLDTFVTVCGIAIVVHAAWTIAKRVRSLPAKKVVVRRPAWLVAIVIAAILLIIAVVTEFTDFIIRREDVTGEAILLAGPSPLVQSAIGSNIRVRWPISGTFEVSATQGRADINIPVVGTKGRGDLLVSATKTSGRWHITKEVVSVGNAYQTLTSLERQKE